MKMELTLPALERLLGGDTEIELDFRRQVVENFAEKKLKALLNDETWKAVYSRWESEIKGIIGQKMAEAIQAKQDIANKAADGTGPMPSETMYLWSMNEMLKKRCQEIVDETVLKTVEYQKRYWREEVRRMVQKAVEIDINKQVDEEIQRRLLIAKEAK